MSFFWQNNWKHQTPTPIKCLWGDDGEKGGRKERRRERRREERKEGLLGFGGILILFLVCCTSHHCLRFAVSPSLVLSESIPGLQNKIILQNNNLRTQKMVQCWCMLAEREPCTYMYSADTSENKGCDSVSSSHDMCLSPLHNIYSVVNLPEYMRRMENNLPRPSCIQGCLCTRSVYVCVHASQPLVLLVLRLSVPSPTHPLVCMWWCTFEGTACGILALKNIYIVMVEKNTRSVYRIWIY